jgi:hypothetical protein
MMTNEIFYFAEGMLGAVRVNDWKCRIMFRNA